MTRPAPGASKKIDAASRAKSSVLTKGDTAQTNSTIAQCQVDQQRLLRIFSDAFGSVLFSEGFPALLQEIKQALFNREFAAAFGKEEYLEAYAARWSPTRALCYASIFRGMQPYIEEMLAQEPSTKETQPSTESCQESIQEDTLSSSKPLRTLKAICVGGCAAEQVAFASHVRTFSYLGDLTLLDAAPWSHVTAVLRTQTTLPPPLSKYASATAKEANKALIDPCQLTCTFRQADVLALDQDEWTRLVGAAEPVLLTMMFTVNELYTEGGIGRATRFLRILGQVLPSSSLLLVVDSPGSYSEAAVGKEKKRYPMQWLLNHTLMEDKDKTYSWERLESKDAIWFRLPEGLDYPIQLENMRYQLHLYRLHKQ